MHEDKQSQPQELSIDQRVDVSLAIARYLRERKQLHEKSIELEQRHAKEIKDLDQLRSEARDLLNKVFDILGPNRLSVVDINYKSYVVETYGQVEQGVAITPVERI